MPVFPVIIPRHPAFKASSVEEEAGRLISLMLRGMWVAKTFCIGYVGKLKMEFGTFPDCSAVVLVVIVEFGQKD